MLKQTLITRGYTLEQAEAIAVIFERHSRTHVKDKDNTPVILESDFPRVVDRLQEVFAHEPREVKR